MWNSFAEHYLEISVLIPLFSIKKRLEVYITSGLFINKIRRRLYSLAIDKAYMDNIMGYKILNQ